MSTTEAELTLLKAIALQFDGAIDYNKLAQDIGCKTKKGAYEKWRLYKLKLNATAGSPAPKATKTAATKKTPVKKNIKAKTPPSKKRKMADSDGDDSEDGKDEMLAVKKFQEERDSDLGAGGPAETPSRSLPSRNARAKSLKQESSDDEEEQYDQFEDAVQGPSYSGYEGYGDDEEPEEA